MIISDVIYTYELGKEIPEDATHVVIPDEIEEIDEHDFLRCRNNLKSVMYKNGEIVRDIKDVLCKFEYYKGKLGEFYYNPDEFEIQSNGVDFLEYCGEESDGSKITIPSGLVSARNMFQNHYSLTKAPVIPMSVKDCHMMFCNCKNLKETSVIPKSVKNCEYMFHGCKNLIEAPVIPESVKDCMSMFWYCKNLTEAPAIPEGVEDCRSMFHCCENLIKAPVIPESVGDYCQCMFSGCSEEVQEAGQWNIEHRGLNYYVDGPGKKSMKREIPDVDDAEDDSIGKGLGE